MLVIVLFHLLALSFANDVYDASKLPSDQADEVALKSVVLLNELRAAGFTCPDFTIYPPNPTPLLFDCRLWRSAQLHGKHMAENNYFSAIGLDGSSGGIRAMMQGVTTNGENLAGGQSTAAQVIETWKKSAPHCNTMMNPDKAVVGVGYVDAPSSQYQHYWVQQFAWQQEVANLDQDCYDPVTPSSTPGGTCIFEEEEHDIVSDADGVFQELNQCHNDMEDSCACRSICQEDANHLSFQWRPNENPNCCCYVFA